MERLTWATVRFSFEVNVLADDDEDALYFAELAFQDHAEGITFEDMSAEVIGYGVEEV